MLTKTIKIVPPSTGQYGTPLAIDQELSNKKFLQIITVT